MVQSNILQTLIDQELRLINETDEDQQATQPVENGRDNLQNLINLQARFMILLGIPAIEPGAEYLNNPVFEAAVDGIVTESAEVLSALSTITKPWKNKPIEVVRAEVLEESVDVLFMLLEIFILAGLDSDDLIKMYKHKLGYNLLRLSKTDRTSPEVVQWMGELTNGIPQEES